MDDETALYDSIARRCVGCGVLISITGICHRRASRNGCYVAADSSSKWAGQYVCLDCLYGDEESTGHENTPAQAIMNRRATRQGWNHGHRRDIPIAITDIYASRQRIIDRNDLPKPRIRYDRGFAVWIASNREVHSGGCTGIGASPLIAYLEWLNEAESYYQRRAS